MLSPLGPRAVEDVTVCARLPRAGRLRLGRLRLGAPVVRARRRRARGADPADARADPLLRRARVRRRPLPAARAQRGARRGAPPRRAASAPAGAPVLALLALAGLLRPEAWAFSGLYWLYLIVWTASVAPTRRLPARGRRRRDAARRARRARARAALTLLAAAAPLVWMLSDLAITGDALWSLTNTRHTAHTLERVTGIANVPEYVPRRIGEILRPPVLVGAALGGVLSLLWLRRRALGGAVGGRARGARVRRRRRGRAADQHALRASSRRRSCASSAAPACSAGRAWRAGDPRRRWWMAAGALVLVALRRLHARRSTKARTAKWTNWRASRASRTTCWRSCDDHSITLRCGPVGVPNHAPVPLLALYLKTSPANVVSAQVGDDRRRRVRRPGEQGGRRGLRARPARPAPPGQRAAGLRRGARQPLVADLPALLGMERTVHPSSRHRLPIADRRPRLRSGNARCACRGSLKAASFRT